MTVIAKLHQQAKQYLIEGNYVKAAGFYEQAIEAEPEIKSHYWHLGLTLLLQGQETEAQMTWLLAIAEGEPEQVDLWTLELIEVLQAEAERQRELGEDKVAWAIRQHIREVSPDDINNLLQLIQLSVKLEKFIGEDLNSLRVIELLKSKQNLEVKQDLLLEVLGTVLKHTPFSQPLLEFAEACIPYVQESTAFLNAVVPAYIEIGHFNNQPGVAVNLVKLCLRLEPENLGLLANLAGFYQNVGEYDKGIETAKKCYYLQQTLESNIYTSHTLLRGLMSAGGYWEEAVDVFQRHISLLSKLIQEHPTPLEQPQTQSLFSSTFFLPYFRDEAQSNRLFQNQVTQLCQANIQIYGREKIERYNKRHSVKGNDTSNKPLKIGYLSHCLRMHSVGWLARWLFNYHDRNRFQLYAYSVSSEKTNDSVDQWYINQVFKFRKLGMNGLEVAEQIYQDEIDILIDLDSITLDISCEVMALKPAPVQVTWLGWDASGIPAIDYFIADPYVLPDSAEDYYKEKIWRLPQTYIAIDGFEIAVPNLRRDQLDIPNDAVVYFSGQRGYKRHPDTVRLQMRIISEVPNSYLLIKGLADQESLKNSFNQIAQEEGVSCDRLRFLPYAASEATHRANLGIADVVLDTYPYNGATTTLETLWMCIPLVTRVGQQFAARNSYTMMVNAGLTEGIAWTDEEYIEWGVRLGKDANLRQQISWKLRQSRQTAPLWNGKQFTREMEKAYEQMWQRYVK
ncbi:MAG: O-linked N-acetylglucosamine transferase, SPINDLY family protein [Coleofasciculaceae cyanobacterium]